MSRGIYDKINKVRIPTAGAETVPIDSALSSSSTHAVQNKVVTNAISGNTSELNSHKAEDVVDTDGIHGFRVNNGTPQYYDNGWTSIQVASGSTIVVTTEEEDLFGRPVTLTDGTTTLTSAFSSAGSCTFSGVQLSGVLTLSSSSIGGDTAEETIEVLYYAKYEVELGFVYIYGVAWDGSSSPVMTRTDEAASFSDPVPQLSDGNGGWTAGSSPFDTISPWKDMTIVEDADAGTLVSIPKYYYKWTKTGIAMTLQISMKRFEGSHVSPAHAERGDGLGERNVVYVGRYHCASDNKSKTGVKPKTSATRESFRTAIHSLGAGIWQYDFAMYWTIMMLYLVEFANWNSKSVIGLGCGNGSSTENMGATDSMTYHTGTTAVNRTNQYGSVQYRHIEGLWSNVMDWCDGIYFAGTSKADVYVINDPTNFSDTTGGTKVGTRPTYEGYIYAWNVPSVSGLEWALYPSAVDSAYSYLYVEDYCRYNSSGVVLRVGGYYYQSSWFGIFCLYGYDAASYAYSEVGSRLMKLPNNS